MYRDWKRTSRGMRRISHEKCHVNIWKNAQHQGLVSYSQWNTTLYMLQWLLSKDKRLQMLGKDAGNKRNHWWECKIVQLSQKAVRSFLTKLKDASYNIWPSNALLGTCLKKVKEILMLLCLLQHFSQQLR
jgi:hypothetical protein